MTKKHEKRFERIQELKEKYNNLPNKKLIDINWDNSEYNFIVVDKLKSITSVPNASYLQIKAAIQIILSWSLTDSYNDRNNHSVLWAKTQGGKTGVTIALINILRMTGLDITFGIKKYFFICGMNGNNLHNQTAKRVIKDVVGLNNNDLILQVLQDDTILGYDDNIIKQIEDKKSAFIYVLKNSHLKAINESTVANVVFENCLIQMDEVQFGQGEKNVLTEFIDNGGVDYKNSSELVAKHVYMVSVSATAYDDIYSDICECKHLIELEVKPGIIGDSQSGYIGHSDFYRNGQVIDANGSIEEIYDAIDDTHFRINTDNRPGICYIRTSDKNTKTIIGDSSISNRFNCVEINCKNGKIDFDKIRDKYELLITAPNQKPIIFLIKGSYTAGDTLTEGHDKYQNLKDKNIKDYVYMIYDFTNGKEETTIQRMTGRISGYRDNCKYAGITKFYVNEEHILKHIIHEINPKLREHVPSTINNNPNTDTKCKFVFRHELPIDKTLAKKILQKHEEGNANFMKKLVTEIYPIDFDYIGENYISGENNYLPSVHKKWFTQNRNSINAFRRKGKEKLDTSDINKTYIHTVLHGNEDTDYKLVIWEGIIEEKSSNTRKLVDIKTT